MGKTSFAACLDATKKEACQNLLKKPGQTDRQTGRQEVTAPPPEHYYHHFHASSTPGMVAWPPPYSSDLHVHPCAEVTAPATKTGPGSNPGPEPSPEPGHR